MAGSDSANVTQEALGGPAGPCTMVIFGAGGDLTKRLLIPAIYNLAAGKLLPEHFAIVGVSIEPFTTEQFREQATKDIHQFATCAVQDESWNWFVKRIYYACGDFHDANLYAKLKDTLGQTEKEQGTQGNCLFYLATSPEFFPVVVQQLGAAGLTEQEDEKWKRVVIEKPFGHDLPSAMALKKIGRASCRERV